VLLATFAVGFSLFTGLSWLKLMERIGIGAERALAWFKARREAREDRRIGEQSLQERVAVVERTREDEEDREPIVVVPPVLSVEVERWSRRSSGRSSSTCPTRPSRRCRSSRTRRLPPRR